MKNLITTIYSVSLALGICTYNVNKANAKTKEKVLYLSIGAMPCTLDPSISGCTYGALQIGNIYEGLLEYHYLKRPAELIPNLAESMPKISKNGLVYTFKIKKGVYFHDNKCFPNGKGRELVAQDFVYSIMRFANPKLQSPTYSMVDGKIAGLNEWREKNKDTEKVNYNTSIQGLKTLNKYTLQITLTKPWPQFMNMLAMNCFFAIPKEAVDHYGKEFANHPVGTGPFIMKKFNPLENKIIAYKNPTFRKKYYPTEASKECKHLLLKGKKRLPFLDRVETIIQVEEHPKWLNFMSKKLDIIGLGGLPDLSKKIKDNEPAQEYKKQGILFMRKPVSTTGMYVMNNTVAPFKNNIHLRQAISIAYDRNKANKIFNDSMDIFANSVIPPGLAGYEKDFVNVNNTYNLEKAKQLMIKAGYPKGKGLDPITIHTSATTRSRQGAEFLQSCLAKIGIKLIVSTSSWPELINKMYSGKTQMHGVGCSVDYPDAEDFLTIFAKSKLSYGGYYNSKYNKLHAQISVMNDCPKRTNIYKKMNRILAHDVPVLFGCHDVSMKFYYSWVLNYNFFEPTQQDYVQYIDIDLDKKKKLSKK